MRFSPSKTQVLRENMCGSLFPSAANNRKIFQNFANQHVDFVGIATFPWKKWIRNCHKVGPVMSYKWGYVLIPINRGWNNSSETHVFSAMYRGTMSLHLQRLARGPTLHRMMKGWGMVKFTYRQGWCIVKPDAPSNHWRVPRTEFREVHNWIPQKV